MNETTRALTPLPLAERIDCDFRGVPELEIVSESGSTDVARIFVARTRPGFGDGLIEFVDGLDSNHPRHEKWIINVSTQFGCPVGCRFCDAAHRYQGDLTADEMLAQVKAVVERHPGLTGYCNKVKVHFARMGEPALNRNVLEALTRLPGAIRAPGLWACVATTAPAGTESWFERLMTVKNLHFGGRFQLQFSVNTTDQAYRAQLTPTRLQPFEWINAYAARFHQPTERRVVLNFALGEDVPFDANDLARAFDPTHFCVKLTPLNPTSEGTARGLKSAARAMLENARNAAADRGFETILSIGDPREDDIGSNCGQSVRRLSEQS